MFAVESAPLGGAYRDCWINTTGFRPAVFVDSETTALING
jgi:hypothetical protein